MIDVSKVPGPADVVHASLALLDAIAEARHLALSGATGPEYNEAMEFAEDLARLLDQGLRALADPPATMLDALATYRAQLADLSQLQLSNQATDS